MKINPSIVITELEEYLKLYNILLSEEAKKTLIDIEEFAYRCDNPANFNLFFSKVIRNSKIVQNILIDSDINPNLLALILEQYFYNTIDKLSNYNKEAYSYSQIYDGRKENEKAAIIDRAIEYSVKEKRRVLEDIDIFLAAMDEYERILDLDNGRWTDKRLNNSMTLSHLCGCYNENLWIKFDDIRKALLNVKKSDTYFKIA